MPSHIVPIRSPFWWVRWVPATLVLSALLLFAVMAGSSVLVPLLVSFALTFMLEPLVEWFQRRRLSRSLAVLAAMISATLGVLLILLVLLPSVYHQLQESIDRVPEAIQAASSRVQDGVGYARTHLRSDVLTRIQTAVDNVRREPGRITDAATGWLQKGLFGLVNIGSAALGLLIVPFFVYYLLLDMNNIREAVDRRIPTRHRAAGVKLFDEIGDVVRGYVRGRFLVAGAMALIYATGLFVFRVPLALGIGIIAGLVGIVPYLGVMSGLVLALGFALLHGAGPLRLLGVVGVFITAQLIEDYILTPRLIGDRLELHPMLVFIALIIAGDLFGLLGLVLAIPVLAVCKVIVRFFDQLYLHSEFYQGPNIHMSEPAGLLVREAVAAATSHALQEAEIAHSEQVRERIPSRPERKQGRRKR